MSSETVIVVAAGSGPTIDVRRTAGERLVVAADGGLDRARALGLRADVVVGDLDSVTPESLAEAERDGTRIVRFSTAKDETDLELALAHALEQSPRRIEVIASDGGRLDHTLALCLALASPTLADVEVDAWVGTATVHVVRTARDLQGCPGELLTLLPVGGPATGVRTAGLSYPLEGETLAASSCRGVSNRFAAEDVSVSLETGVLLAIRPGATGEGTS
jgi:thiamine pyrophosphokinase